MNISDELLAAYVDGDLKGAERARVEQAIARDTRLAQRVAQFRASRARFRRFDSNKRRFDGALHEPMPQRLMQTAQSTGRPSTAQVIDLARVRAERKRRNERHRFFQPHRVVIVASLAGGLLLGAVSMRLLSGTSLTRYRDGTLVANGALAEALDHQLTGSPLPGNDVQVQMSFKDKGGTYCRTFAVGSGALAGLACHEGGGWHVVNLVDGSGASLSATPGPVAATAVAGAHPNATLQPAVGHSGTPSAARRARVSTAKPAATATASTATMSAPIPAPLLREAIRSRMAGAPLDAQAEARARGADWR